MNIQQMYYQMAILISAKIYLRMKMLNEEFHVAMNNVKKMDNET